MIIQTVKLVNSCFNLELNCKKAGRTNRGDRVVRQAHIELLTFSFFFSL